MPDGEAVKVKGEAKERLVFEPKKGESVPLFLKRVELESGMRIETLKGLTGKERIDSAVIAQKMDGSDVLRINWRYPPTKPVAELKMKKIESIAEMNRRLGLTAPEPPLTTYVAGATASEVWYGGLSKEEKEKWDRVTREQMKEDWKGYAKETGKFAISLIPFSWVIDEMTALSNSKSIKEANIHLGVIMAFGLTDAVSVVTFGAGTALRATVGKGIRDRLIKQGVEKGVAEDFANGFVNTISRNRAAAGNATRMLSQADNEFREEIKGQIAKEIAAKMEFRSREELTQARSMAKSIVRNVEKEAKSAFRAAMKPRDFYLNAKFVKSQFESGASVYDVINIMYNAGRNRVMMPKEFLGIVEREAPEAAKDIRKCIKEGRLSIEKVDDELLKELGEEGVGIAERERQIVYSQQAKKISVPYFKIPAMTTEDFTRALKNIGYREVEDTKKERKFFNDRLKHGITISKPHTGVYEREVIEHILKYDFKDLPNADAVKAQLKMSIKNVMKIK